MKNDEWKLLNKIAINLDYKAVIKILHDICEILIENDKNLINDNYIFVNEENDKINVRILPNINNNNESKNYSFLEWARKWVYRNANKNEAFWKIIKSIDNFYNENLELKECLKKLNELLINDINFNAKSIKINKNVKKGLVFTLFGNKNKTNKNEENNTEDFKLSDNKQVKQIVEVVEVPLPPPPPPVSFTARNANIVNNQDFQNTPIIQKISVSQSDNNKVIQFENENNTKSKVSGLFLDLFNKKSKQDKSQIEKNSLSEQLKDANDNSKEMLLEEHNLTTEQIQLSAPYGTITRIISNETDFVELNQDLTERENINKSIEKEEETEFLLTKDESTEFLEEYPKARLTHKQSGKNAIIYTDIFTIGKSKVKPIDLLIDNKHVGNFHAVIHRNPKTNKFTIRDENSKNGTFINNQRLIPSTDVEIKNTDIITFANEVYIFST